MVEPMVNSVGSKRSATSQGNEVGRRFGELIRRARLQAGLQQRDLARKAGVTADMISEIETGKRVPRLDNAIALMLALQLNVRELAWVGGFSQLAEAVSPSVQTRLDELERTVDQLLGDRKKR